MAFGVKVRATLRGTTEFTVIEGTVVGAGGGGTADHKTPFIEIDIPAQRIWVHENDWRLETQEWHPYPPTERQET
mgnify:CR=1 FL=1